MKILFIRTTEKLQTGGSLVLQAILDKLRRKAEVVEVRSIVELEHYSHNRTLAVVKAFFQFPLSCMKAFKLAFVKDCYLFGYDVVYVQPHANFSDTKLKTKIASFSNNIILFIASLPIRAKRRIHPVQRVYLFNSKWTEETSKRIPSNALRFILYPPVNMIEYNSSQKDEHLIVTVARYEPEKKVAIVGQISNILTDYRFVVIGFAPGKPYHAYVETLRSQYPRAEFIENASQDVKKDYLQKASIYFHPTPFEPFGISVVEAMSCGCIPVVHNSGGPMEFVPRHFRYETLEEAAAIIQSLYTEDDRNEIIKLSTQFTYEKFNEKLSSIMPYIESAPLQSP